MYTVQMKMMMGNYVIAKLNFSYRAKLTDEMTSVGQVCYRFVGSDMEVPFTPSNFMPV